MLHTRVTLSLSNGYESWTALLVGFNITCTVFVSCRRRQLFHWITCVCHFWVWKNWYFRFSCLTWKSNNDDTEIVLRTPQVHSVFEDAFCTKSCMLMNCFFLVLLGVKDFLHARRDNFVIKCVKNPIWTHHNKLMFSFYFESQNVWLTDNHQWISSYFRNLVLCITHCPCGSETSREDLHLLKISFGHPG